MRYRWDEATGPLPEEYAEVVGDLDKWEVDDERSFPAQAGKHAATGTQIVLDLDVGQAEAVTRAADARGMDLVRFVKQAVLDAARGPASHTVGQHVPRRSVTVTNEELEALLRETEDLIARGRPDRRQP